MSALPFSYLSSKLEARPTAHGFGTFVREVVFAGELLTLWGGQVMKPEHFFALDEHLRSISIQVEEDLYLVPIRTEDADYFNHSCNPNAGITGHAGLVAMRNIMPGEEISFDYAMSDGTPYDEFTCGCGAQNCRGRVTGNDWQIEELWERYNGYFSPYIQRRIDAYRFSQETIPAEVMTMSI